MQENACLSSGRKNAYRAGEANRWNVKSYSGYSPDDLWRLEGMLDRWNERHARALAELAERLTEELREALRAWPRG